MDDKIGSPIDQSEINAISLEIDNTNVEGFSLESNTNHSQSQERKKGQWDKGDNSNENEFQNFHLFSQYLHQECVSKFPFIEACYFK